MNFTPRFPLQHGSEQLDLRSEGVLHAQSEHTGSEAFRFDPPAHVDTADAVKVPDAHLLFSGEFVRSGRDLIISDDLHRVVVPNYFAGEKRPTLVSPEGAAVDHTLVEALTGHLQYAQAQGPDPAAKVVGHIVKMTGSSSIIRNGVAVVANTGDTILKNDVIETGSNSTIGLVLEDGSAFNLSEKTRFMLNDLNYDPSSTSNSSLMTLVQGAANFIAGQVAPTGDMKIATPVAVIGVRGTVGLLDVSASDGTVHVSVVDQQDQQVHAVQIFNNAGDLIGTASSNGPALSLTPAGNFQVVVQQTDKSPAQIGQEFTAFQQVLNTYDTGKQQFPNLPQHTENTNQNNSNTGATKAAAVGSTPVLPSQPPSTTVFTDPSAKTAGNLLQTASVINPVSVTGSAPTTVSQTTTSDNLQISSGAALSPITISNVGGVTNLSSVTITGTADAGTTVKLLDTYSGGTTQVGTATADPGGTWTANVTLQGDGTNTIIAQDTSGATVSSPVTFTLDSKPPSISIVSPGGPTTHAAQTISGTVAAAAGEAAVGSTVKLFDTVNGVTTQVGTAPVDSAGNWSATVTLSGNGVHSIVAEDTDAAGNTGISSSLTFTLSGLPTVTIDAVDSNNVINSAEAHAAGGVPLSGSITGLAPGSTFNVTVTDNGVTKTYVATVDGTGTAWTATIPAGDATTLADGTATVTALVIDAIGNQVSVSQAVTVTETLPTLTLAAVDGNNVINAANAAAGVALSGSVAGVAANSTFTVTVTDNGVIKTYTATVNGAGTGWTATIPSTDAKALADGTATIAAQVTDSFGNPASFSQNIAVAEALPTLTLAAVDGNNVINATNAAAGVSLSGSVSGLAANSTFTVTVTDSSMVKSYTATVNGAGGWTATIPSTDAAALANGTATIAAQVTDAHGNPASFSQAVTVAETLPTVTINPVDGTNVINAANANAAAGVALSGSVSGLAANSTFTVTVTDNGVIKSYTATVNGSGGWIATIPSSDATALANGTATIAAQVTDSHGNPASFSQAVTVAETLPTVAINAVDGNNVINAANAAAGVALSGSGSGLAANSTFSVTVTDNGVIKTYTATVNGAGTGWTASIPSSDATSLPNGTATIAAQVTDSHGNPASFSQNVTVAESGPTVTLNAVDGNNVINAANAAAGVALSGSISGIAANSTFNVTVTDNGVIKTYTATVNGAGTGWTASIPSSDATSLPNGTATIAAQVTDSHGNPAGFSQNVTVAEALPTVSSLTDVTSNGSDLDAGQTVTFTLTASETLTVAAGAALTLSNGASAVYNSTTQKFVYTVASGDTNTSDLKVTGYTGSITDGAGNALVQGGVTLDTHVQIDTTAPTVSSLTDVTSNGSDLNAGQTVTFTLAASETLTVAAGAALTLSNGASAIYNSTTQKFVYTVASGDTNTSDLKVTGYTGSITDGAGNALVQAGVTLDTHVQIDTVAPTVSITTTGTTTNQNVQTISGTVDVNDVGATVNIYDNNGTTPVATTTVLTGGSWSTSVTLVTGTNSLVAKVTDGAGNTGTSNTISFDLNTTAPTVSSLTDVTSNGSDLNAGQTVTFSLTASETLTVAAGAALTLSNGASAIYNSTTQKFVYTVASGDTNTSDLKVTGYTGSITDGAGNALVQAGVTLDTHVQIDTVAPTVSITTTGTTTNQNVQTISGTVDVNDVGATVNIYDNNGTTPVATTTVLTGGSWSTSVTLVTGTNSLVAKVTDGAGNTGTSNTVVFTLPTFTVQWIGPNNGSWGTSTNWSPANVPGATDDVLIGVADTVDFTTGSSTIDGLDSTAGSILSVSGGTFTVSSASTVSNLQGSLALSGGTFTDNAQMILASLNQTGGTLTGTGTLTVTGSAASLWTAGTQTGAGRTIFDGTLTLFNGPLQTVTIDGGRTVQLGGNGTVADQTAASFGETLDLNNASNLIIAAGATFADTTTTGNGNGLTITNAGSGSSVVTNDGTYTKTGNGTTVVNVAFNNAGTSSNPVAVNVQNGTLDLAGGGTDSWVTYAGAGTIDFGGGTRTLDANSSITANAAFSGSSATSTTINGTYNAASTNVSGGTAFLPIATAGLGSTTVSGGTLNLEGSTATAASLNQTGGTLTGTGTLTVTGSAASLWTAGTQTGAGRTIFGGALTLFNGPLQTVTIDGGRTVQLGGNGTVADQTAASFGETLDLNNASNLIIAAGATFADTTTTGNGNGLTITNAGSGSSVVTNDGTYTKTGNGTTVVNVAFNNAGLISVQQGTLQLVNTLTDLSGGSLFVQNATIELAAVSGGADVAFGGTTGLLQLDSTVSSAVSAAVSASGGAISITGNGSVTSTSADAIDATSSGGNISITPAGAITGALIGISAVQTGVGNITVTATGPVIGQSGQGIFTEESSSASGSILINGSGNVTGTGNANSGILAEILNAANSGNITVSQTGNVSGGYDGIRAFTDGNGNVSVTTGSGVSISGGQLFGILELSYGTGNLSISTATNDTITSASAGLVAQNDATSIPQVGGNTTNTISITAVGTINSGAALTATNNVPAGIIAGYAGATSGNGTPNAAVFGNVTVNNSANINSASGDGIRTFNYGNGNITVSDLAGKITAPGRFGIVSSIYGAGSLTVSTSAGNEIDSGSSGIQANDNGTNVPGSANSTVSVTARGIINSGFMPTGGGNGVPAGISAGYNNGGSGTTSGNIHGNVLVDSFATVNAALGFGVGLFNVGVGNLTATLESSSVISAQTVGVNAYAQGGGSVTITNNGIVTAATGVGISTGTGNVPGGASGVIAVTNTGTVSALGSIDKPVVQINNDSTATATFTNSGTVTSQLFSANTQNQALAIYNGNATVNNSGTITGNVNLATATFNNNSGATWNVDGSNFFGSGANVIANAGTINISNVAIFSASGTLAFENAGAVNLAGDTYAFIGGPVSPLDATNGTFSIGDFSTLEFGGSVAAGQTISFVDGDADLTIDNPSAFSGTIANLGIGNTILLQGITIPNSSNVSISGPITPGGSIYDLTITEANSQTLVYQIEFQSGITPSSVSFSLLSPDEILLAPSSATVITGTSAPLAEGSSSTPKFYILSNATISGSGAPGFAASSSDTTASDFLTVEITQGSSISGLSGTFNGVNLTTTSNANIALVNAGSIASAGGVGINTNTNSGPGSTIIVDYGNVSGATFGINANTSGTGEILVAINANATVTATGAGTASGTPTFAISAVSAGGNVVVNTSPGDSFTSGSTGINAQDHAASIAQANNSSISVSAYGTINSGATPPSSGNEPGGIKVGYNGGSNAPTTAVFGNVFVNNNANINAAGGIGIFAFNDGVGNIAITDNSSATITATAAGATSGSSSAQYGIGAFGYEAGNTTVSAGPGSTINSGSSGIEAVNQAATIAPVQTSTVTVVALGTINSGANSTNSDGAPAGIEAAFFPPGNAFDANVNGNVFVDFGGSITAAAGDGIKAFDYGVGNVSVNVESGASITAMNSATAASNNAPYGIGAFNYGPGNIIVTTSNGDSITSGSSGIEATNQATAIAAAADAVISVTNQGFIDSGTILTNINTEPSGITAGFLGGTTATVNPNVNGTVIVDNAGSIAAADYGINTFNYGNGDITVANHGSVSGGLAAIDAMPTSTSTATIDNYGVLLGEVISYNASFINESGADWSIVGAADAFTGTSTLVNIGLIESNGTSSITGLSGTTNVGTIQVETGSLKIAGPVTGGGTVTIFGATMEFAAASDAHVQFDTGVLSTGVSTTGTLTLDDVAHFTGTVTGFSSGDTIDLVGISPSNVSVTNSGGLHVNYGTGSFALAGNYAASGFAIGTDNGGGTDIVWNDAAPSVVTNNFTVTNNADGTTTVSGLQISDADPGATVTITATTVQASSGSTISPASDAGSLAQINSTLTTGIIYNPGATPPTKDMVTLTATDNFGATETVHFVFNENSNLNLTGTPGNDVIFSSGSSDVLTGGGGMDQFVFKPTSGPTAVQHTITDFSPSLDTIDLRQFTAITSTSQLTETQAGNNTLITIDATDSVLLKNVEAASLHANNFILHA